MTSARTTDRFSTKVLLAGDPENLKDIEQSLRGLNCEVKSFVSGAELLHDLEKSEVGVSVIVLDLATASPNGFQILKNLRQLPHTRQTPVLIASHEVASENQQNQEITHNQSRYLEYILNRVQAAIMLIDPESGDIKFANETARGMGNGFDQNLNTMSDEFLLLDSNGDPVSKNLFPRARAARGEKISGLEYTWKTPNGTWDFLMYSELIPEMHGQPKTSLLSFLDISKLKTVERDLQKREQELRELANSIPQLAWMAHPNGDIFWYNHRWYDYTGTTSEDMKDWGWRSVHDPEILPQVLEIYQRTIQTGESASMEFPLRSKTGEFRWFLTKWTPLKDQDGQVLRWFGTNTDIHEQKLLSQDQAFRADLTTRFNSARSLNEMVQIATSSIAKYLKAARCFVTEISGDQATVHTDFSEELNSLKGEYDIKVFGNDIVEAWKSGKVIVVEDVKTDDRTRGSEGSHLELGIHSFVTVSLIREGSLVGALNVADQAPRNWSAREIGLIQSVAETVWAEFERSQLVDALKESTKRSLFLSNASHILNSTLDINKILKTLSDLAVPDFADWCSIRMRNHEGLLEQVSVSHKDPDKVKWAWELQKKFPPNRESQQGPYQVLRTGKSELMRSINDETLRKASATADQYEILRSIGFASYICVPILSRDQAVGTITLATSDESGRKYSQDDLSLAKELGARVGIAVENARLYRESQAVNRLKDEFLANLSHELRTPLNVIKGYAEILKTEMDSMSPREILESVEAIERNAKTQTSIISDLLDVSSIITGKVVYNPVQLDPVETIRRIIDGFQPTALAKKIHLSHDLHQAPALVTADATRLHQILWNLISNALKFTEPGGQIKISVVQEDDTEWSITVKDTGIGIEKDFLPYAFDRFRQEDASTTRRFGGLGLGLSVVRHLVELHGGRVQVHSEGKGLGAVFTVTLPLQAPRNESEQPEKNPAP